MNDIAQLLNKDDIISEAKTRAGLSNFGNMYFAEALQRLLDSLITQANLSIEGAYGQRERTINLLVNRLRIEQAFSEHPAIHNETIEAPIIIVGLPRTGTTLLSRILSCNPEFYTLYWWECRNPAPFPNADPQKEDPRIASARVMIQEILDNVPALAAVHPFDAEAHDEEILLLEHTFYSTVPEASAWVPDYQEWLEKQDQQPAYNDLKRMLKFLQWQKKKRGIKAKRWVLKTPHHLHFMPELQTTFSDALIIQTHRDPVATIPSLASMYAFLYELVSTEVDRIALGKFILKKWSDSMQRCIQFRQNTNHQILDINYLETIKDPNSVIKKIFSSIDFTFNENTQISIEQWLEENRRENRKKHNYALADFGLDKDSLNKNFALYKHQFLTNSHT